MTTHMFTTMKFHDAQRAMSLLTAMGFTQVAVYADDDNPAVVQHAEYVWREGGGLMFGSVGVGDSALDERAGSGACYCIVDDEAAVDRVHAAALAAGATSHREPASPDYGGRECCVRDAEGNLFSFGTYAGAGA